MLDGCNFEPGPKKWKHLRAQGATGVGDLHAQVGDGNAMKENL